MRKIYLLFMCLALHAAAMQAETQDVVVTINGKALTKRLTEVYFSTTSENGYQFAEASEESICLVFTDAEGKKTREYYHPTTVQLWFNADPDGIEDVRLFNADELDGKLRLRGIAPGTPVKVYDTAGKMCLSTTAGKQTRIDLNGLGRGIYIIRAGKTAIKFMKK